MAATSTQFVFEHRAEFLPETSDELLRTIPAAPGVFALRGADPAAEPYLTRASDLRRRLRRLLAPPEALGEDGQPVPSKRLNLRARIRFIEWTRTGSEFESSLLLYRAACSVFGATAGTALGADEARRRLRLHVPYMLRITLSQRHPRVYSTNRLNKRWLHEFLGPFPSRAAADRYCDAVLDLFQLRRCYEDLEPYPEHPGCVYGEMNKCMQPCKEGNPGACTPEQYAQEAQSVFAFFSTRGQSLLDELVCRRDAASATMDFETAAELHKHWEKVRAAVLLADELVRPIDQLRVLILQQAASREEAEQGGLATTDASGDAAVFLFEHGRIAGPERLSTLGIRAVREQAAVGSSLFAQPLMLAAVPLDEPGSGALPAQPTAAMLAPEDRARAVLEALSAETLSARVQTAPGTSDLGYHLALLRRWYYCPEKQRAGEVLLPNPDGSWPIRRMLNGAARVVLGRTPPRTIKRATEDGSSPRAQPSAEPR